MTNSARSKEANIAHCADYITVSNVKELTGSRVANLLPQIHKIAEFSRARRKIDNAVNKAASAQHAFY